VTIPAGAGQTHILLTPSNDGEDEGSESVTVTLAAGSGFTLTSASATHFIQDDERAEYFTQAFKSGFLEPTFDLSNRTITLTPNGSSSFYGTSSSLGVTAFPTSTAGHTNLESAGGVVGNADDGYWSMTNQVANFYGSGTATTTLHISTNGFVNIGGTPDSSVSDPLDGTAFFAQKRIAMFATDLDPGAGGDVFLGRVTTAGQQRTIITWANVRRYNTTDTINAQLELFDSGALRLTWLTCTGGNPVVGLSNQTGTTPANFQETNLSNLSGTVGNNLPTFLTTAVTKGTTGTVYAYPVAAADGDASAVLTITAPTLPTWLSLQNASNGQALLTGTPPSSGSYNVSLQVSDGTATELQTFSIAVQAPNNAPPAITSVAVVQANANSTYSYTISATDANSDALSFSNILKPTWLNLVDNGNGTATLSGVAPDTAVRTHTVSLAVTDGSLTTLQSFVIQLNRLPTITLTSPADGHVELPDRQDMLHLEATARDDGLPLNSTLTSQWQTITAAGDVIYANSNSLHTTAQFSAPGFYLLRLQVSDGSGNSSQDVQVFVETDGDASLQTSLQGYWKFDEATGTTSSDSSGNGRNLSFTGTLTWPSGVAGSSIGTDASATQYAQTAASAGHAAQTSLSMWLMPAASPSTSTSARYLFTAVNGGNAWWRIYQQSSSSRLRFDSPHATRGVWELGYDLPALEWTHLVLSYDQTNLANNPTAYINGKPVSATRLTAPAGTLNTSNQVRIGSSAANAGQTWQGRLDEVRLYHRNITAGEVSRLLRTQPLNTAPNVFAGENVDTTPNQVILLNGMVDEISGVTTRWSQVSGPAVGQISSPSSLNSTFLPGTTAGNYLLALTATDDQVRVSSRLLINSIVTASPYQTWSNTFPSLAGAAALPTADPDADGYTNLVEYALSGHPTTAAGSLVSVVQGPKLGIRFTRNPSATDVTIRVQVSSTLTNDWVNLAISTNGSQTAAAQAGVEVMETTTGSGIIVTVKDSATVAASSRRFLRLTVE
jgi:hypothetical protein